MRFTRHTVALTVLFSFVAYSKVAADYTSWNRPTYSVNVLPPDTSPDPRVFGQLADTERKVEVVREDGSTIVCDIPVIANEGTDTSSGTRSNLTEEEVLAPLKSNCLHMLVGWWTYEFCYGRHVKQYHVEPTGEKTASFFLGKNLAGEEEGAEGEVTEWGVEGGKSDAYVVTDLPKEYYSHFYGGGTVCDLTGKPREVEVRMVCEPSDRVGQMVAIKEPSTCSYLLHVHVGLLCKHPAYAKKRKLINHIICSPLVESSPDMGTQVVAEVGNVDLEDPSRVQHMVERAAHASPTEQARVDLPNRDLQIEL